MTDTVITCAARTHADSFIGSRVHGFTGSVVQWFSGSVVQWFSGSLPSVPALDPAQQPLLKHSISALLRGRCIDINFGQMLTARTVQKFAHQTAIKACISAGEQPLR